MRLGGLPVAPQSRLQVPAAIFDYSQNSELQADPPEANQVSGESEVFQKHLYRLTIHVLTDMNGDSERDAA